jgi:hypothetical protein
VKEYVTGDLGAYLNSYLNSFSFDCGQFWARVKETLGYLFASAKLLQSISSLDYCDRWLIEDWSCLSWITKFIWFIAASSVLDFYTCASNDLNDSAANLSIQPHFRCVWFSYGSLKI